MKRRDDRDHRLPESRSVSDLLDSIEARLTRLEEILGTRGGCEVPAEGQGENPQVVNGVCVRCGSAILNGKHLREDLAPCHNQSD